MAGLRILAWCLVVPLYRLNRRLFGSSDMLTRLFHLLPGEAIAHCARVAGATVGEGTRFLGHLQLINLSSDDLRHLQTGDGCYFGQDILLDLVCEIRLGHRVALAPRVMILTHASPASESLLTRCPFPPMSAPVSIEDDAWIGAGAILLPGVRVGRAAMVAAGSIVTHDVPPHTLVAGSPARFIKRLRSLPAPA